MGTPRTKVDADYIISAYLKGRSVKSLANELNVSRNVICQRLKSVGITPRGRSESMYLRMSQASFEERQRLAHNANVAKRGLPNSPEMLHKRALARSRRIGVFEQEFIDAITAAGIDVCPQEPFLSYNLDIGCGNIAVEVHTQMASPLTTSHIKKLMNCLNAGKSMIYVWIPPRNLTVAPVCYDKVISIIKEFRRCPPSISKYWVVRRTGELYATGSFNCD